ncbi:MAG: hypothetical protein ACJ71K_15865 [Nitrososphaeraceae archaeon]
MNEYFELPSLEEIEEMDRKQSQAIESLHIYDHHSVKCQKRGIAIPIVDKLARPHYDRIAILQKRIKWIENYNHGNNSNKNDDLRQVKAELADLLEEDAKADKLRSIPLYSCRITGFKFVCSRCYDKVYIYAIANQRPSLRLYMFLCISLGSIRLIGRLLQVADQSLKFNKPLTLSTIYTQL